MEQMVRCSNCGTANPPGQQFCGKCGAKLATEVQQQKIKCPNCGFQNLPGQQFCGSCGAKLIAVAQPASTVPTQQVSTVPTQQVSNITTHEAPTVPAQKVPTKVVKPVVPDQQVDVKPTWGLAWGLWWRMVVLGLLIGGIVYFAVVVVMVLAFNYKLPFGA